MGIFVAISAHAINFVCFFFLVLVSSPLRKSFQEAERLSGEIFGKTTAFFFSITN